MHPSFMHSTIIQIKQQFMVGWFSLVITISNIDFQLSREITITTLKGSVDNN